MMYVDNVSFDWFLIKVLVSDSASGHESEDSEINYYSASSSYPALLSCSITGKGSCSIGMDYKACL